MAHPHSASPATTTAGPSTSTSIKHVISPLDKQRAQLEKLLKDPSKPVYIPPPPKDKTIRPAREMMKNVQGSSAGAGSGEFHVYKASRRREYERIKMMDEKVQKEAADKEFAAKKRQWEEEADAKTSKNRAKRLKKKERSKVKASSNRDTDADEIKSSEANTQQGTPFKKRRMVNGAEVVFHKPREGEEDASSEDEMGPSPLPSTVSETQTPPSSVPDATQVPVIDAPKIVIHDD